MSNRALAILIGIILIIILGLTVQKYHRQASLSTIPKASASNSTVSPPTSGSSNISGAAYNEQPPMMSASGASTQNISK